MECTLERWGNPTQICIDEVGSTSRLPQHFGEREAESPRHILCVDQDGDMRRHELYRVHPRQHGGLVSSTGVYALDPSLGVGWQEILSWCSMEWARHMELVIGQSESHQAHSSIKDTRGPGWHWDPGGTPHHFMDWASHGTSRKVDLMIELTLIFIFPSKF